MARRKLLFSPLAAETRPSTKLDPRVHRIPAMQIGLREDQTDTRPLTPRHVVDLAESVSVLGLLEPIVVDEQGQLLAGAHRRAAVQLLAIQDPDKRRDVFLSQICQSEAVEAGAGGREAVAVTALPEVQSLAQRISELDVTVFHALYGDVAAVPIQVVRTPAAGRSAEQFRLAVEAAENNVRRSYTREEIVALAERLRQAGYRSAPGRPRRGERRMLSALQAAVGRSKRQIQNILSAEAASPARRRVSAWTKVVSDLERVAQRVVEEGEGRLSARNRSIVMAARQALEAVRQ